MSNPYLLLWFEAPLQSWGYDSKFGRRDSLNFPTKSAVLGLVCSALGAGGEQTELLRDLSALNMVVISFNKLNTNGKQRPRQPMLLDFHMVGSGYDDKDPWQSLLIPKTSDGKKAVGGGTKITYRYYLQDATFAILLEIPASHSKGIVDAMQNPTWDIYLGRKSCIPTEFVYQGIFDSDELAESQAMCIAKKKNLVRYFTVLQGEHEGDESLILNDVPIQFGNQKKYRDRQVTIVYNDGDCSE
jgi:CRISPR system Cascade subunit CasD